MSKPALTPEEWTECLRDPLDYGRPPMMHGQFLVFAGIPEPISRLDAMAALCLHEQPGGFTHEDVTRHRNSAKAIRVNLESQGPVGTWDFQQEEISSKKRHAAWHDSMADRIEALLPPEGP